MISKSVVLSVTLLGAAATATAQQSSPGASTAAWQLPASSVAANCRASVARAKATVNGLLSAPAKARTFATVIKPVESPRHDEQRGERVRLHVLRVAGQGGARFGERLQPGGDELFGEATADPRLYQAAERASKEKLSTVADRQLVTLYLQNGRHGGAALDSATRVRTTAMLQRIADLGRDYEMALGEDTSSIRISDAESAGLPQQFLAGLKHDSSGYVVPTNESTIGLRAEREVVGGAPSLHADVWQPWRDGEHPAAANAVAIRDTLAHLFGFPTWAAYQLDVKVAKTPQRVISFLDQIDAGLLPKAREEVARLGPIAEQDTLGHTVQAWDVSYYSEQLRRSKYALNSEAVRQYFPVDHVVRSVEDIYQELFGLRFTEVEPANAWSPR